MKIAITGKGGSGKTTIAGAVARHMAARGHKVLAVDADPNPNLGISLGLPPAKAEAVQPILNALLAAGYTHHDPKIEPEELVERFGVEAPDGVVMVATGKVERPGEGCMCCGSHMTTRQFFGAVPDEGRIVVADLEAGMNDLVWTRPGINDVVLVVADPTAKAIEIARRSAEMARTMGVERILGVANRAVGGGHADDMAEVMSAEVLCVPEDPAVEKADNLAMAAMDHDPCSPAMLAIGSIADRLLAMPVVPPRGQATVSG